MSSPNSIDDIEDVIIKRLQATEDDNNEQLNNADLLSEHQRTTLRSQNAMLGWLIPNIEQMLELGKKGNLPRLESSNGKEESEGKGK